VARGEVTQGALAIYGSGVCFFIKDRVKLIAYRIFDRQLSGLLVKIHGK
jgi:hypothetical protein